MDSVQLTSPRAQFFTRSLQKGEAAKSFDRLTWTDQALAGEVAAELTRATDSPKTLQSLTEILEKGRDPKPFAPHARELARTTSKHGARKENTPFYRTLLERFPEQVTPHTLVHEVLPNEGSIWVALDHIKAHPEWHGAIADAILAQDNPSPDALEALGYTADASHKSSLQARLQQPGELQTEIIIALGRLPHGLDADRLATLQRMQSSDKLVRQFYAGDVMAPKGYRDAVTSLLDRDTADHLLSDLEKAKKPFDQLSRAQQIAVAMLGSVELPPDLAQRFVDLCAPELGRKQSDYGLDQVLEPLRARYQGSQMVAVRESKTRDEKVAAARNHLQATIHRVIPSSLEFQTREIVQQLKNQLSEDEQKSLAQDLLQEFLQDSKAQDALWLAHCLGADVTQAVLPHVGSRLSGPLEALGSAARRELINQLSGELLQAPLDAAPPLVERLLTMQEPDEVYETWNQALPEDHWVTAYSEDPQERYDACYCADPELFRELHGRLQEHEATLTAYHEIQRLIDQGVPKGQARERALFGYLVPGAAQPRQHLEVTRHGVQVGGVRLKRKRDLGKD